MKLVFIAISTLILSSPLQVRAQTLYHIDHGNAAFKSDAELELIEARTTKIVGILDSDRKVFAVSIPISSFQGFNSALQREHFNENYMESAKYPKGIYKGVIVGDVDFKKNGYYQVVSRGKLSIHGVEKARDVECTLIVADDMVRVEGTFIVPLAEHNIKIPTVVRHKLAETIIVNIEANFALRK